jgi:hypothetical protein
LTDSRALTANRALIAKRALTAKRRHKQAALAAYTHTGRQAQAEKDVVGQGAPSR